MNVIQSKRLHYLHLILGFFFITAGFLTLFKDDTIKSLWILSLGLFFLFYILKAMFKSKTKSALLDIAHYVLALFVLVAGLITLFK